MKLIERFLARRGYLPEAKAKAMANVAARRGYAAAAGGRLLSDWTVTPMSADEEIRPTLKKLRARARDLAMNNDHARKFLRLLEINVVGPKGIRLQNKAKDPGGKLDVYANDQVETAWIRWGRRENATVTRRLSWRDVQALAIRAVARDGEFLARKVRGYRNPFGYALQLLESDHLDEEYNLELPGGGRIRMGVELDKWGAPVAYHLLTRHPGDQAGFAGQRRERVPAEEIIHLYLVERVGQTRGVTWFASPATRMKMLGGYEEAELVAARTAAAKMGFFKEQAPESFDGERDENDDIVMDAEPGSFAKLPPGVDFQAWDPQHPGANFGPFVKHVLRSISCGLGVSYNALASDLEGVNYSSLRQGALEDRDAWMILQEWLIDHLARPVFEDVLDHALVAGIIPLPASKFDKFNAPSWQPRRWAWVDPLKEQEAYQAAVDGRFRSRSEVVAEMGGDFEETIAEIKAEEDFAKSMGVSLPAAQAQQKKEVASGGSQEN